MGLLNQRTVGGMSSLVAITVQQMNNRDEQSSSLLRWQQ